mgnify:FL=1
MIATANQNIPLEQQVSYKDSYSLSIIAVLTLTVGLHQKNVTVFFHKIISNNLLSKHTQCTS